MGSSVAENTDQDMSAAEDLVGDLEGQTRNLGGGEEQASAERELQHDFVGELQR